MLQQEIYKSNLIEFDERNINQSGFVMITVLLVMHLLLLFSCLLVENAALELKNARRQLGLQHLYFLAEKRLKTIEYKINHVKMQCLIPVSILDNVVLRLLTKDNLLTNCDGFDGGAFFSYRIESLGVDSCTKIGNKGNIGHYWRITLLLTQHLGASVLLQAVILSSEQAKTSCLGDVYRMPQGRVAWREIQY